ACDAGFQCLGVQQCANGSCAAYGVAGSSCSIFPSFVACKLGDTCDDPKLLSPGTCQPLSGVDGGCWYGGQCQPGLGCTGIDFFANKRGVCSAQKTAGAACVGDGGSSEECVAGDYCTATAAMAGSCAALATAGQPCNAGTCAVRLTCNAATGGVCVADACYDPTP